MRYDGASVSMPWSTSTYSPFLWSSGEDAEPRWSPQRPGVNPLNPGNASFQAIPCVVVHLVGRPDSVLTPFSAGPRHCGQLSARRGVLAARSSRHVARRLGSMTLGYARLGSGVLGF